MFELCNIELLNDTEFERKYESTFSIEKNNTSGNCAVSEYETYGNWLYFSYPDVMLLEKSITYDNNMKFHKFNPTQENLDANPGIIPMRNTYDFDIDWTPIYPDWKF